MTNIHRVLTIDTNVADRVRSALLDSIETVLSDHGAERIWIDPAQQHSLVVLAEFPEAQQERISS